MSDGSEISATEADLLLEVNKGLPSNLQERYNYLIAAAWLVASVTLQAA